MLETSIGMGMRAMLILKGFSPMHRIFHPSMEVSRCSRSFTVRNCSTGKASSLQPPDLPRLAQTARISLTPDEVEVFAPKIGQVIDWFGQLQAVDLDNVDPSIRADTEGDNLREDVPETFENREAIVDSIPVYEDQYLKVPKVLNKE